MGVPGRLNESTYAKSLEHTVTPSQSPTSVSHQWSKRQHICLHLLPPIGLRVHARRAGFPFCANCICFAFILSEHHVKAINDECQKGVTSLKTKLNTL